MLKIPGFGNTQPLAGITATSRLMTDELKKYLLEQCRQWMLPEEIRALSRGGLTEHGEKTTREIAEKEKKETLTDFKIERMYGFNDPKTNELVNLGHEKMLSTIAQRLLERQGDSIVNKCTKCNKLTRTPNAKQCRHCGHDWH
ncbi:hypothetical protein DMB68_17800 [Flavobacterium hydrophilum]|uniref:Uncharacterized protein n=1 Tax=Flavobacterium hydrophilum TaxID=2211445 RepID=A0A2V4BYZ2_9FLAO|nr:hypothetical protein DMB68_17800 [Flavobacterium hydrophilum]